MPDDDALTRDDRLKVVTNALDSCDLCESAIATMRNESAADLRDLLAQVERTLAMRKAGLLWHKEKLQLRG